MTTDSKSGSTSGNALAPRFERRRHVRRIPAVDESLHRVRSRTGHELDVIDVSDGGLLVEGRPRLLPNTHLDIHVVTREGRVLVRCRVVRAAVWELGSASVRYRTGLAFDRRVDTAPGYSVHAENPTESEPTGTRYPNGDASAVFAPPVTRTA